MQIASGVRDMRRNLRAKRMMNARWLSRTEWECDVLSPCDIRLEYYAMGN